MNHQKNKTNGSLPYAIGALAVAVLLTAMRCINLFFFFDTEIGYHTSGAVLPLLTDLLLILASLALAVTAVLLFRERPLRYEVTDSFAVRILGGLCGLCFLLLAVSDGMRGASVLSLIFGLGAALYFLGVATRKQSPLLQALTGLCAIIRLVLALANAYFNIEIQMNAPDKLFFLLGCLGGMLFLVGELRAAVSDARPILSRFSAACALSLSAVGSLPSIIGHHAGILEVGTNLLAYYLLFLLSLYAGARLIGMARCPVLPEEESAEEVLLCAEPQEIETADSETEETNPFEKEEETTQEKQEESDDKEEQA